MPAVRAPVYAPRPMEGRTTPPPPERGPGREYVRERAWEDDDLERAQLAEGLAAARRWAYFATLLAALAAVGAAVAIAFALDDDRGRSGASRSSVRALQEDVSGLRRRLSSARASGEDAESTADSLSSRVDELEQELSNAQGPDEGTQRMLDRLNDELETLSGKVDDLSRDAGSSSDASP
jgi:septal ring factor EnvC (AmiA/AmiB activator)